MKTKRTLSFILALTTVLLTFASCSEKTDDGAKETTPTPADTQTPPDESTPDGGESEESEKILPDLPDVTFDGENFTVYESSNAEYGTVKDDFFAEEINAEPINDAKYNRNLAIENKYGVKVVVEIEQTLGDPAGTNKIKQSVQTADYMCDIAMLAGYSTANLSRDNFLLDLKSVEYIDLSKPWWDQRAEEDLTVANKLFYTTGDISVADNEATYCLMYNKNMAADHQIQVNPYDMVDEGTWTIDNYATLISGVTEDVDGNGVYDDKDRYGVLIWDDSIMGVINGAGQKCCKVEDGEIKLTLYNETTVSVLEKYFAFALDKSISYAYQRTNWDDKLITTMFQNNQALFIQQLLQLVPKLREMDSDFGILPYYKYSEEQTEYYNTVGSWHSVFLCVPKVQSNIEKTGIITEALAAESIDTLTTAYYDITLKGKGARDTDSQRMLDLIFKTRAYDLGWYYAIGSYNENVMNLFRNYNSDFTSMYSKSEKVAKKVLDRLNESFAEVE